MSIFRRFHRLAEVSARFLRRVAVPRALELVGLTLLLVLAGGCGAKVDEPAGNQPETAAVATKQQAFHEGSVVKVAFDLYWYSLGLDDLGDGDMWGRASDNGAFNPPNFQQGDLEPGFDGGIGATPIGRDSNLVLTFNVAPGVRFFSLDIGMVEDDGQTSDDDIHDVDPGADGDIDIVVDLATGMFTGEASNLCPGCQVPTAGIPGDGSSGFIFRVIVENECIGALEILGDGIDNDCDDLIDELPCCCGNGETCNSTVDDPACTSDRDGDGLLDIWETRGFDADCDAANTVDVNLPAWGVSPDHKDILVEYDMMGLGSEPTQAMIRAAKITFRNAPIYTGNVDNPDGKPGVNLLVDTGPLRDFGGVEPGPRAGACNDGVDNDLDGLTDLDDQDCLNSFGLEGVGPCDDGVDNDNDGSSDAFDPDCDFTNNPEGEGTCSDGIDNDNDGTRDAIPSGGIAADSECLQATAREGAGTCLDGIDNDGDGLNEGVDPDCLAGDFLQDLPGTPTGGGHIIAPAHFPKGGRIAGDDASLDGPGLAFRPVKALYFSPNRELFFHYVLSGIDRDLTVTESGAPATEGGLGGDRACEDYTDNDGDGFADLYDTDCWTCDNGVDDDMDGNIDGADPNCILFGNPRYAGIGEGNGNDLVVVTSDAMRSVVSGPNVGQAYRNRRMTGPTPATFIHELGHNLGLGHGGHEARNCKPNYVSVMNYMYTLGVQQLGSQEQDENRNGIVRDAITLDFWPPRRSIGRGDYVSTITENALFETAVIDAADTDNQLTYYRQAIPGGASASWEKKPLRGEDFGTTCMVTPDGVPDGIDWNDDCAIATTPIAVDIGGTSFGCETGISADPMVAQNDWRAMDLKFRDNPDGAPGSGSPHGSELRAIHDALHRSDLDLNAEGVMRADGRFELSLDLENIGPQPSVYTYLSVPLPPGASLFESSAAECQEYTGGTNRMVICSLRRAEVGEVFGVTLVFDVASAATCQFEAVAQNALDETGQSVTSTVADCGVDVSVTMSAAPNPALAGGPLTYHVTVANAGPSRAENVVATILLPAGTSFQGATTSCAEGPTNTLTCTLGGMNKGQSTSFEVSAAIASNLVFLNGGPAMITGVASVTSSTEPELNAANNVVNVATQVVASADLELVSIAALSPPTELVVGSPVDVVVQEVVNNHGLASPINAVVLQTGTATTGASATPVAASVSAPAVVRDTPQTVSSTFSLRCDRAGTHTFTLGAEVRPASALDTDPNAANDARQTTVTVNCTPCLHATLSLNLKDDTLVTSGEVLGGTAFELGAQQATVTGNVFVRGNAILRSTSVVNGNLTLFGVVSPLSQTPYTVTGTLLQNTSVTIPPIPTKTIPIGTVDLTVPVNGSQTWAAGNYDEGTVFSNGEAHLSAGVYNFRRLALSPDTDLVLDTSAGNILINARDFAEFGDRTRFLKSGSGKVFVHSNSTGIVRVGVDVEYRASLRAPQATVNAFSDTVFEGCVAARRITFEPQVSLVQPAGAGAP